jgi:hypothetical protein
MTGVARGHPDGWGLDDMLVLVAEARASGSASLEAEILRRYGFAVPTEAALDEIVASSPRGVLELGAGTGHWAALLARRGIDVVACDVAPPPSPANAWFAGVQPWHGVHRGDERVVGECAERSLLLVWPTRNETWASDALDRYHAAGGDHVVFVGEGPGGRTGDSGFHARLGETAGCIACTYGVVDTACTCGIAAIWTRTSRTTLPPWQGAETALYVYVPARADERRSWRRRRRRER